MTRCDADVKPAPPRNNLQRVQGVAAGGPALPLDEADTGSIRIHVCHSARREVEVLHDYLLDLFETTEVRPGDVAVVTPDPDAYRPFVEEVFPASRQPMALHVAGARRGVGEAGTDVMLRSLNLVGTRYKVPDVLDWLETGPVLGDLTDRTGLRHTLHNWVMRQRIRWGIDPGQLQRAGFPAEWPAYLAARHRPAAAIVAGRRRGRRRGRRPAHRQHRCRTRDRRVARSTSHRNQRPCLPAAPQRNPAHHPPVVRHPQRLRNTDLHRIRRRQAVRRSFSCRTAIAAGTGRTTQPDSPGQFPGTSQLPQRHPGYHRSGQGLESRHHHLHRNGRPPPASLPRSGHPRPERRQTARENTGFCLRSHPAVAPTGRPVPTGCRPPAVSGLPAHPGHPIASELHRNAPERQQRTGTLSHAHYAGRPSCRAVSPGTNLVYHQAENGSCPAAFQPEVFP